MNLKKYMNAAITAVAVAFGATAANAATIDLGFSLVGSGSVGNTNFAITRDALADALAQIPTSGPNQYRVAVTQFGSNVGTIVAPVIVTAANIMSIQDQVRAAVRITGGTNTTGAINNLVSLFGNLNAGTLENMRRIASIGTTGVVSDIGAILTDSDNIPNAIDQGFVVQVSNFQDYEAAISAKVGRVVDDTGGGDPNVVPLPAGLPLLLVGVGALGVARRFKAKAA